jgi:hypothetical protein
MKPERRSIACGTATMPTTDTVRRTTFRFELVRKFELVRVKKAPSASSAMRRLPLW